MTDWLAERDRLDDAFVNGLRGRAATIYLLDIYRCDQQLGLAHPETEPPPTDQQAALRRLILEKSAHPSTTYELAMMEGMGDGDAQRLIHRAAAGDAAAIRQVIEGWG